MTTGEGIPTTDSRGRDAGWYGIELSYDGAAFAGFARQPGLETVQGRLEDALSVAFRGPIETVGAGRTDAGVHALAQVVSFSAEAGVDPDRLRRSLDALTGDGIVVRSVRPARPGFSARFDATSREYRYRIAVGCSEPLFLNRFAWYVRKPLNLRAMESAASRLVGEYDFRSFCKADSAVGKRTIRRVDSIDFAEEQHLGEACLTIRVVGNAFLHSMVRVMVGSLQEVGKGQREPEWISEVLEARDRAAAGQSAPARGLTFWSVTYPDEVWIR